mgnify:CR=1 FL=1
MGNASLESQTAFMTMLQADMQLKAMITGVFDEVRIDTPLPYISIGTITEQAWPTFGHINADLLIIADIWYAWTGYEDGLLLLS